MSQYCAIFTELKQRVPRIKRLNFNDFQNLSDATDRRCSVEQLAKQKM